MHIRQPESVYWAVRECVLGSQRGCIGQSESVYWAVQLERCLLGMQLERCVLGSQSSGIEDIE